jgi:CheY-like chemotaxis protein
MTDYTRILLVEDNKEDAFLFETALRKAGLVTTLHRTADGEEAINYLSGRGLFADRLRFPLPSLIFIDLKMPKVSGFDLLAWIQNEIRPRFFSTIVLTGSDLPQDKSRAAALGADHYWIKPDETNGLVKLLHSLETIIRPLPSRTILLIEDREEDFILTQRACENLDPPVRIVNVPDGVEALKYISGTGPYSNRKEHPFPDLILVDLNLPRASGTEVLAKISALPGPQIPIVVLTGCLSESDEVAAIACGAADCLEKPTSLVDLTKAMSQLHRRFLANPIPDQGRN